MNLINIIDFFYLLRLFIEKNIFLKCLIKSNVHLLYRIKKQS